jgi:hypothetical protein
MVQPCARHKVMWARVDRFPGAKKCVGVNWLHTYPSDKHVPLTRFWAPHPHHGDVIPVSVAAWPTCVSPTMILCAAGIMTAMRVVIHEENGDIILMVCQS